MALVDLSEKENKVVYECIKAAAFGPFFPDTIFHTLFGVEKAEMQKIASEWPNVVESSPNVMVALNNSLNNLTGYPHNCHDIWSEYISVPADEVLDIFYKWLGKERPNPQKWDGVIKGAFTRNAQISWEKLSLEKRNEYLNNAWCPFCNKNTIITNYQGAIDLDGGITIYGVCVLCFESIEIIIEGIS